MLKKYSKRKSEYYGFCLKCENEVKGKEEVGLGQRKTIIRFNCPYCRSKWFKEKYKLEIAVAGGYKNGYGEWIKCDQDGKPFPEELKRIQEECKKNIMISVKNNLMKRI